MLLLIKLWYTRCNLQDKRFEYEKMLAERCAGIRSLLCFLFPKNDKK